MDLVPGQGTKNPGCMAKKKKRMYHKTFFLLGPYRKLIYPILGKT